MIFVIKKEIANVKQNQNLQRGRVQSLEIRVHGKTIETNQGSDGVCLVPCMRQCGGGASVQFEGHGEVLKLRDTNEVAYLLCSSSGALATAC